MHGRSTKVGAAITAVLVVAALTGCASAGTTTAAARTAPAHTASPTTTAAPAGVDASGTGPEDVTVRVPASHPRYLMAEFACSTGTGGYTLQEDPRVFAQDTCSGLDDTSDYQIPLPAGSTVHLDVQLPTTSSFTLVGRFCNDAC